MAAITHNAITRHGWRTTASPSPPNGPGPAVSARRPPPAARRTAESVAYTCLLLAMSLPRCVLPRRGRWSFGLGFQGVSWPKLRSLAERGPRPQVPDEGDPGTPGD